MRAFYRGVGAVMVIAGVLALTGCGNATLEDKDGASAAEEATPRTANDDFEDRAKAAATSYFEGKQMIASGNAADMKFANGELDAWAQLAAPFGVPVMKNDGSRQTTWDRIYCVLTATPDADIPEDDGVSPSQLIPADSYQFGQLTNIAVDVTQSPNLGGAVEIDVTGVAFDSTMVHVTSANERAPAAITAHCSVGTNSTYHPYTWTSGYAFNVQD